MHFVSDVIVPKGNERNLSNVNFEKFKVTSAYIDTIIGNSHQNMIPIATKEQNIWKSIWHLDVHPKV